MRTFEIVLLGACALAIVWPALFGVRTRRGIVAAVLLVAMIVQWRLEGFRWQLTPLYLVALGLLVGDLVSVEREVPMFHRVGRGVFGLVGLGLVSVTAFVLPVPELPAPAGPLGVGTATFQLVDDERQETYGRGVGLRRLAVRVWYPAEVTDEPPVLFEPDIDIVGPALAERAGTPGFFFNHLQLTSSHAVERAPRLDGSFPVIIYVHDWQGIKHESLDTIEALVSQGYVVVAADHPYAALVTRVGDSTLSFDPAALEPAENSEASVSDLEADLVGVIAEDLAFLITAFEAGEDSPFGDVASAIDAGVIGVWGTGLGGGAALEVCLTDERCVAVAATDPWVESLPDNVLAQSATSPMLLVRSDSWRNTQNDAVLRGLAERSQTFTYWVGVLGTRHADFTAIPLFSPFGDRLGLKGSIDGDLMVAINHRLLTGFFDQFMLGAGSASLDTLDFGVVDIERIDNRTSQ